jgi:hypothetical protein
MDDDVSLSNHLERPAFAAKQRGCADCGQLFDGQGSHCERCLNRKYYEEALGQRQALFAGASDLAVLVTKRNQPQLAHLALVGHASVPCCGMPLHPRASRSWLSLGPGEQFRRNTCPKCLEVFHKVTGRRVGITEARI